MTSYPFKISVIVRCARVDGLVRTLLDIFDQNYADQAWEIILVDWLYEERKELIEFLVDNHGGGIKFAHVPPLDPIPYRGSYDSWDIPLSFNTGWSYAQGEYCVHIEDYWRLKPGWLYNHVKEIEAHPNTLVFGELLQWDDVHTGKTYGFDENAPTHYYKMSNRDFMNFTNPDLKDLVLKDPKSFICVNRGNYGQAICVNFSHKTEFALKCNGLPEVPTRNPESLMYRFLDQGLSIYTPDGMPAWHKSHPGGRITGHILSFDFQGGVPQYKPVRRTEPFEIVALSTEEHDRHTRDIKAERQKRGFWV